MRSVERGSGRIDIVPDAASETLLPPLSFCWNDALPVLRDFTADPTGPWQAAAERLGRVAEFL